MTDIFISYSRQNSPFVKRLFEALAEQKRDTWVDWEGIPLTADWWAEIQAGIEAADTFVFILSPNSLASSVCTLEVAHAVSCGKRIVPVLHIKPDESAAFAAIAEQSARRDHEEMLAGRDLLILARDNWQTLKKMNWVYFQAEDDFDAALQKLLVAIDTDLAHTKQHTRLLVRAREWQENNDDPDLLLHGDELRKAQNWLEFNQDKEPKPTDLQKAYIAASGAEELRREEADRRERDDKIRLAAEAAFNKRLYDRIKGYVFRFVFAAMGFGIGISLLIAALYLDPQQERTSQRLLAALLSVVLGTFFGAAMLFVVDFLPQLRHRWWQAAAAAALGWLACDMGLLMLVYIYYSEPLLKWLPFTTLVIVSGFALPSLLKVQIGWRLIAGIGAVFLALFFPWLIDSGHAPIVFLSDWGDISVPLCLWMAISFTVGTYLPEIAQWFRTVQSAGAKYVLTKE